MSSFDSLHARSLKMIYSWTLKTTEDNEVRTCSYVRVRLPFDRGVGTVNCIIILSAAECTQVSFE